jgi:hypothetical protein
MCTQFDPIGQYFKNKNENTMNEYRGFKVGDKVEITSFFNVRSEGVITSFGDRKVGGFAEPDTLEVWVNKICCFDLLYLIRQDKIKKLPKYAVGDVVRRNNKQMIKCTVTMVHPDFAYSVDDCGDLKFRETDLIPFDGFRVGDTVFTVKRGKGKIASKHITKGGHESWKKPFWVLFDDGHETNPKKENLIPTESLYKEALNKTGYAFKIDVAYVHEYVAKPKNEAAERQAEKIAKIKAAGEAFYQAAKNMAAAIGRTTDQIKFPSGGVVYQCPPIPEHLIVSREPIMKFQVAPSAKFKVGDAVYFDRKKWDVEDVATNECKIRISASAGSCTREFRAWTVVKESDLRLWVETKLTHCLQTLSNTWYPTSCVSKYEKIIHLGGFRIDGETRDIFACYGKNGKLILWAGIKGDDTTESI